MLRVRIAENQLVRHTVFLTGISGYFQAEFDLLSFGSLPGRTYWRRATSLGFMILTIFSAVIQHVAKTVVVLMTLNAQNPTEG